MQFGSSHFLLLRYAVSSSLSVIKPSPSRRAISVLFASYSSYCSSCGQFTSRRSRNEEDSRSVSVSVWWDFENCHLPAGANVFKLAQTITSSVRINGIKGPITITAFGDLVQLSKTNQEALSETGINLTHVPQGGKNSTDRSLITDLMYWVSQNPPPAHLFLISSDRDFASMLHRLRMNNYNILLAGNEETTPSVLCSAATIMWDWDDLVRGKSSIGKHFNHPPDGPYNSWYGHNTTPLLNPYATIKQQSCNSIKTADSKEVVKQISLILRCYPKGVAITELREELSKRNVWLGRDFYGHKNFSSFLLSMPKILKVVPVRDGVFLIHAVTQGMDNEAPLLKRSSGNPKVVSVDIKRQKIDQSDGDVKVKSLSQVSSQNSVLVINQMDVKSRDESVKETQHAIVARDDVSSSKEKVGFFRSLTRTWFGSPDKDMESQIASCTSNEYAMEVKANTEVGNEKSESPGIFSRLLKRYEFSWGRNTKLNNATENGPPLVDEFSKDSSWKYLKSFNNSPRGFVVYYSRSRVKDEGLSSLNPLVLSKMLDLSSLLISEKKWTKESSCDALPLSVTQFTETSSGFTNSRSSVELKSVFVNSEKSQSDEASGEYKSENIALSQKPIVRSRSEVIADCQRLIKKITEENPGGYNMGNFRNDFRERIGYPLDLYYLGYSKLQSFIQTMPEVKIESGHIVPSSMHESDSFFEESDSFFEELGPVSEKIHKYESSHSVTNENACLKQCSEDERKKQIDNETKSELLQIFGDFINKKKNLEDENFDSDTNEQACMKQCSDDEGKKQKDNETKSEWREILRDFDMKPKNLEEENSELDTNEEACVKQSSGNEKKKQKGSKTKSELLQIVGDIDKKQKKNLEEENSNSDINEGCLKQCSEDERKKQIDNETKSELLEILGDFINKQKNLEEENFDSDTNEQACVKQCSDDEGKKQKDNETKSEWREILRDFDMKPKNLEEENSELDTNEEACVKQSSGNEKKKQKGNKTKSELLQIVGDIDKKQKKNLEEDNSNSDINEGCLEQSRGNEKKQTETTTQLFRILGDFHEKQKKPAKTLGDDKIVEGILTTLRKTTSSESKVHD